MTSFAAVCVCHMYLNSCAVYSFVHQQESSYSSATIGDGRTILGEGSRAIYYRAPDSVNTLFSVDQRLVTAK